MMTEQEPLTKRTVSPRKIAVAGVLLVTAILLAMVFAPERDVYARWESPDGRHMVSVYRLQKIFAMPGQGSDAPGMVLLTNRDGIVLNRRRIDMVQLASEPVWGPETVRMKLLFEWRLD